MLGERLKDIHRISLERRKRRYYRELPWILRAMAKNYRVVPFLSGELIDEGTNMTEFCSWCEANGVEYKRSGQCVNVYFT